MTSDDVVSARGLTRSFGPVTAVRAVDLDVAGGEIFGLVGPDGAGKTTIMRMLAGVLRPDAGEIRLAGVDVVADPESARPLLSYMPQRFGLYEDLTVDENIFFHATLFGVPRAVRRTRGEGMLLMGDRVHVRVDDAGRRLDAVRAMLVARGIGDAEVTRIEPTIEDVFVALLGAGDEG